jgi:hypothetical protein
LDEDITEIAKRNRYEKSERSITIFLEHNGITKIVVSSPQLDRSEILQLFYTRFPTARPAIKFHHSKILLSEDYHFIIYSENEGAMAWLESEPTIELPQVPTIVISLRRF